MPAKNRLKHAICPLSSVTPRRVVARTHPEPVTNTTGAGPAAFSRGRDETLRAPQHATCRLFYHIRRTRQSNTRRRRSRRGVARNLLSSRRACRGPAEQASRPPGCSRRGEADVQEVTQSVLLSVRRIEPLQPSCCYQTPRRPHPRALRFPSEVPAVRLQYEPLLLIHWGETRVRYACRGAR